MRDSEVASVCNKQFVPLDNLIFVANDFYQGLIKPLKVAKGHVTYVDGEI